MALTVLSPVSPFFQPELTKWYWMTTIAAFSTTGATLAEMGASSTVDITAQLVDSSGFTVSTADLAVPDANLRFVGSIPGRKTADAASQDFYCSSTTGDIRATLTDGLPGYLVRMLNGAVTGSSTDYFKVSVSSVSVVPAVEDVVKVHVNYTVRAVNLNKLYPTS